MTLNEPHGHRLMNDDRQQREDRLARLTPEEMIRTQEARLLIVDDVPRNARVMMESLKDIGKCFIATSGAKALEVVANKLPDLILLDIEMPDMDGYEVLKRLRSDPETASIPVIFVTAKSEEDDEANGLQLGAVDYVTKPFWPPIVRARVHNHLMLKFALERLAALAKIDSLTGAVNRREFYKIATNAVDYRNRYGRPLSVVMLDIDHFKGINDTLGHRSGDEALRAVAETCKAQLRSVDALGRLGGEEFAVLLPEAPIDSAMAVAEKLRAAIAAIRLPGVSGDLRMTASLGVAEGEPDESLELTLHRADQAMYRAKLAGRDRVVMAQPVGTLADS